MRHNDIPNETKREGRTEALTRQEPTGEDTGSLVGIDTTRTITDRVDFDRLTAELPAGWDVRPDLVQSGPEPLAETLLFRRSLSEPQLVLRPADPARPSENIELYERSGPRTTSERSMTVDRLSEALRVAVNRVHQFEC